MKIKPSKEHIRLGITSGSNCPYALAIIAACPALENKIAVLSSQIGIVRDGNHEVFENPPEMTDWIIEYDNFTNRVPWATKTTFLVEAPEVDLPFLDEYCNDLSN